MQHSASAPGAACFMLVSFHREPRACQPAYGLCDPLIPEAQQGFVDRAMGLHRRWRVVLALLCVIFSLGHEDDDGN